MKRLLGLALCCVVSLSAQAAPKSQLLPFWQGSAQSRTVSVDHAPFQQLLERYRKDHPSGVARFDYSAISASNADKALLADYIKSLTQLDPRVLTRDQQMAYWVNLYNAATIDVILKHYPVSSIKKATDSLFSFGPWKKKILTIQGQAVSLNDIEHGILRPIWNDERIHFVVNCASIGCPNLPPQALTKDNLEAVLAASGPEFINHPRGVSFSGNRLQLSTLFDWYGSDFGDNEREILDSLAKYAKPALAQRLRNYSGNIRYEYDWNLNEP